MIVHVLHMGQLLSTLNIHKRVSGLAVSGLAGYSQLAGYQYVFVCMYT